MSVYDQIAVKIIKEQESLMGPVAWYEAAKVKNVTVDEKNGSLTIAESADGRTVVDDLIHEYENLFGRAARQVCKEAVTTLISDLTPAQIPASLQG